MQAAEVEIDRVKSVYVALCEDREKLEINLTEEWKERLNTELKQVIRRTLKVPFSKKNNN